MVVSLAIPGQQTRTVYTFQDNEVIPSYEVLRGRIDQITSQTIKQYRDALRASDEHRAKELLQEMSDVAVITHRISNCYSEVLQSGWTEDQYRKVPELSKKVRDLIRRIRRIQEEAKRTAHSVLF